MRNAWVLLLLMGCDGFGGGNGDDDGWRVDADITPRPDGCVPVTCEQLSASCGDHADGCGETLACGDCLGPATCGGGGVENVCAIPESERECSAGWCWETPAPRPFAPGQVVALAADNAWAVGTSGTVLHFDGMRWNRVEVPTTQHLNGIWMASATEGYIVGDGGTVLHYNGTAWTATAAGAGASSLRGVHGTSPDDVWVVGAAASRHWNGSTWLPAAGTTPDLTRVLALPGGVFAIGEGQIWRHGTGTWTAETPEAPFLEYYDLGGLVGSGTTAYAAGHTSFVGDNEDLVYVWDGTTWTHHELDDDPWLVDAIQVGARFYAVHNTGDLIPMDGGATPTQAPIPIARGVGVGDEVLAWSPSGEPMRFADHTWAPLGFGWHGDLGVGQLVGDSPWFGGRNRLVEWRGGPLEHALPTTEPIVAIAGTARDDVWALDYDDPFWSEHLLHWNGQAWRVFDVPGLREYRALDVHAGEVRIIGEVVQRLTSAPDAQFPTWADDQAPTGAIYRAASRAGEDLYIAGTSTDPSMPPVARVAKRSGGTWTDLPAPAIPIACGLQVTAANDIWLAGYDEGPDAYLDTDDIGYVAHWDGSTWTTQALPGAHELCTIIVSGSDVWTTGHASPIYRRSGSTWSVVPADSLGSLPILVDTPAGLWAAGDHGAILRRVE